jgi:hypothetical protein
MPRCARHERVTIAALRALVMGDAQSSGLEWLGTEASGLRSTAWREPPWSIRNGAMPMVDRWGGDPTR